MKRSASLFRTRWAGQVTGNIAIGGIVGIFGVLPAIALGAVGIALWSANGNGTGIAAGAVLVVIAVLLLVVSLLLIKALQGIFGIALYRFAAEGEVDGRLLRRRARSGGEAPLPEPSLANSRGSLVQMPSTPIAASARIRGSSSTVQAISSRPLSWQAPARRRVITG